jgi:hypothetical protein
MTYPGHAPELFPVDGHGWDRLKASLAAVDLLIRPWLSRPPETDGLAWWVVVDDEWWVDARDGVE